MNGIFRIGHELNELPSGSFLFLAVAGEHHQVGAACGVSPVCPHGNRANDYLKITGFFQAL